MKHSQTLAFVIGFLLYSISSSAQNAKTEKSNLNQAASKVLEVSKSYVDTLTSPFFWGRGYTNDGMGKAARFLQNEFRQIGLKSFKKGTHLQGFSFPVNSFPGKVELSINGKSLKPGEDFIISPESRAVNGSFTMQQADSNIFMNRQSMVVIKTSNKLTWSVAAEVENYTMIEVLNSSLEQSPKSIKVDFEQKLIPDFKADNVIGYVKGTQYPDSFLLISAHYDHLGGMGNATYFPGANDNASGIALLLNLAKYYAANPQPYSIGFICFAGEEAGLKGSDFYVKHPLFPLKKIKFLLNTDLAGTGDDGITVVNATEFPEAFAILNAVNDKDKLVSKINARGKAANSDHYYFSEQGVSAFFFYTLGGIKAYHDVFDKAVTLPLVQQPNLFKLVIAFYDSMMSR